MSLIAVGAYFTRLRDEYRLSRLALSRQIGTSDAQLMRVELGTQDTRGSLVAALVRTLNANPDDVNTLYLSPNATSEDGTRMAEEWIIQRSHGGGDTIHPDIARLLGEMTDYELGRWVTLGERILEDRKRTK